MSTPDALVTWLSGLDDTELEALLERRPGLLLGPPPRNFDELAQRMWHPYSLMAALQSRELPQLQLLEAAQLLGDGCTIAELAHLLAPTDEQHLEQVDRIVGDLAADGIVLADADGQLLLPASLTRIFPQPLGLGVPIRYLLDDLTVDAMRRIQTGLGLERQKNRAETVASLITFYRVIDNLRDVLASAPPGVIDELRGFLSEDDEEEVAPFNLDRYRARKAAVEWTGGHGLSISSGWGREWVIPAEVARALLGPDYQAPFVPRCPEPPTRPLRLALNPASGPAQFDQGAAAAATRFADHALAVLDHVARRPITQVKSGGVGVRELTRISKATRVEVTAVRLILELAFAAGLLRGKGLKVTTSDQFDSWRDAEPGRRLATLLIEWWQMGHTPTQARGDDGRATPALVGAAACSACRLTRTGLVTTMISIGGASEQSAWVETTLWRHPMAHSIPDDAGDPFATVWREAEELGVISQGAVTTLGRALADSEVDATTDLVKTTAAMLPQSADSALFGGDLTAVVVGAPSARVAALLDRAADREVLGSASTWRFSPTSVRRALDEGIAADQLREALASIASGPLPQPLEYLISDVARRHGQLRLTSAQTCIRCDDPALLEAVAADRKLARLDLRLLAPTVLAAAAPSGELMDALRAAGYFPVSDDAPNVVVDLGVGSAPADASELSTQPPDDDPPWPRPQSRHRSKSKSRSRPPPANAREVATRLRRRGTTKLTVVSATETELLRFAKRLSGAEVSLLAQAIDHETGVEIEYESGSGQLTRRVISRIQLRAGSLFAWCELRADDRVFTVSSIKSVMPV